MVVVDVFLEDCKVLLGYIAGIWVSAKLGLPYDNIGEKNSWVCDL